MDILAALAQTKEKESEQELDGAIGNSSIIIKRDANGIITRNSFHSMLEHYGCDSNTIEDCLFEPVSLWERLLEYFRIKAEVGFANWSEIK